MYLTLIQSIFICYVLLNLFKHLHILFSLYMIRQIIKKSTIGRFLYGNLKDSDRIFTNVYKDGDPYIKGALLRVI